MDEINQLIVQILQEDGRVPFTQIAKMLNVSETTIRSRYKNLVKEGIIRVVGVVEPYGLGFKAPALLNISVMPGAIDQVAKNIAKLPEVSYLIMTLGSYDLDVEVYCRDLPHLTELITKRIQTIQNIHSIETLLISKSYKLTYRWPPVSYPE